MKEGIKIGDLTDKELMSEYVSLHSSIFKADCYGVKDMIELELIENELNKRGIEVEEDSTVSFKKNGEEIEE